MAKKNKKSEKLNLSEFLGPEYARALPSAPSGLPAQDGYDNRRRGFDEPSPGGDTWRRGPARGEGGGGGGSAYEERRNRFDDGNAPTSRADDDGEWRKSRPASGRSDAPPPRSAADDSSEWRRKQPERSDRPERSERPERAPLPPSAADESTEWRRREPLRPDSAASAPPTSVADESTEWRRRQPMRADTASPSVTNEESGEWRKREPSIAESPAAPSQADGDNNWRKAQPARPAAISEDATTTTTPKASETDNWRANRVQLPAPEPSNKTAAPKSAGEADTTGDWRSKMKKPNTASPVKRKREGAAVDAEVITPFGKGVLVEERASDSVRVVKLEFGATAFLRGEDVLPPFPKEVTTSYGKGEFIAYRFGDGMCEIELEFGGKAFVKASEILSSNASSSTSSKPARKEGGNNNTNNGNKQRGGKTDSAPPRGRRFGDVERDREREKDFARGERRGRDSEEGGGEGGRQSKSELFAAFSSGKKEKPPTATPPPAVEDKEKAFSAFGGGAPKEGGSAPPRVSREEKEKAFAAFSGPKRGERSEAPPSASAPSRASQPPPQAQSQRDPAAFSAFDRNSAGRGDRERERTSFPGFGNRERGEERPSFGRDDRQSFGGGGRDVGSFPGFSNDRRERRSDPREGREDGRYGGGMERFGGSSRGVPRVGDNQPPHVTPESREEFPSLSQGSRSNEPVDVIAKTLPKGSKWGEDDDEDVAPVVSSKGQQKKEAPVAAAPKKVSMEIALNSVRAIVKEYMIGENKATAIAAMAKLATDDDLEFLATFVANLTARAFDSTKERKLVAGLLIEMNKSNALSPEVIAEGLTRTLESNAGDADKLVALKDIFSQIQEKNGTLLAVALRGDGAKLRDDKKGASESGAKNVDDMAAEVFNAGAAGVDKLKELQFNKVPGAGQALLKVVLKTAELDDAACPWVAANAKTLRSVLYSAPKAEQMKAIEVIQAAFNVAGFPKTSTGAVIDKVFTSLYTKDILPDTAFVAWKDDLSLNAPGRDKAIIQTTPFFQTLEEEEYEDEEDEE